MWQRRMLVSVAALMALAVADSPVYAQDFCFTSPVGYNGDAGERGVVTADFNGDGRADLAVANESTHNVSVLFGNGNGAFGTASNYAVLGDPRCLATLDVDLDGDYDIAVASHASFTYACVLKNNGSGVFSTRYDLPAGDGTEGPFSICATKADADADFDLVTANTSGNTSVFKNNGNGTFAAAVKYAAGGVLTSITSADLDGDGDSDLAAAAYNNTCNVFFNSGTGTFSSRVDYSTASEPWGICAADIDNDGDQDLALASVWGNVSVLRNNGNGTFAPRTDYPTGTAPFAITAADFNQDGRPDLAIADESGPIWVLKNLGSGSFSAAQNIGSGGGGSQHSIVAGFLDADSEPDLAVQSGSVVAVLLNCPPSPRICFSPASPSLMFSAAEGGGLPEAQSFTITNCGGGTLNWSISDGGATWLDQSPITENSNNRLISVSVNTTSLTPGTYNATITVTSSNADNSPQSIPVSYTVQSPPSITSVSISPNPPEIGSQSLISWQSAGAVGPLVRIEAFNGSSWSTLHAGVTNLVGSNNWGWLIPNGTQEPSSDWAGSGRIIRVSSVSFPTVSATSSPFGVSGFNLTSPAGFEDWGAGREYLVTWNKFGGYTLAQIDLSTDNGNSWTQLTGGLGINAGGSYEWDIPSGITPGLYLNPNCLIRIRDALRSEVNDVCNAAFAIRCGAGVDTDGDGLLDLWECNGYDYDGDQVIDVPLQDMGATPDHMDLFVEVDWMPGHEFEQPARDLVVTMFGSADTVNPDGETGIRLHIDAGQGGAFTGGNQIPFDADLNPVWAEFASIKDSHFPSVRRPLFHYCVFGHTYSGGTSSGIAFMPGSDLLVTLGAFPGTYRQQAGTFAHELGHNLGLNHGGGDGLNHKPNYLSIMSYTFQFDGLIVNGQPGHFDYSRWDLPDLDESTGLSESAGLDGPPSIDAYTTVYWCKPTGSCLRKEAPASGPIDWNCDGSISLGPILHDVGGFEDGQECSGNRTILTGFRDWANLVFTGLPPSTPSSRTSPESDTVYEITYERYVEIAVLIGDMDGSKSHDAIDLALLIDEVFFGAPEPDPDYVSDTNCDVLVDAVDLAILIDYVYFGGEYPCD